MTLVPGTLVGQNVRLVRLLGQGGMGSIWVADHLTLHTQVAVKFMSVDVTKSPDALQRFTREASAAAQIKSPHVVQTFDHGFTTEGLPFIVMELLEGENLASRVQRVGALPPGEVSAIVRQVCKALARAHALGIVHRDIKPENIHLTDLDGELLVKVLDFGVAKRAKDQALSMTSTGAMVGTPYYMSPEVMSAKTVDPKTDLWSVAVVAYHAITGRVPFDAETMGALCVAINSVEYQPASRVRPGLPSSVDRFFAKALARDPANRFQTAKELSTALHRAVGFVEDVVSDVSVNRAALGVLPAESPQLVGVPPLASTGGGVKATTNPSPAQGSGPHPAVGTTPEIQPAAAAAVMMPAAAGTLMEASVTASRHKSRRGFYIALGSIAGAIAFVALFGMFLLIRAYTKRYRPDQSVEAAPAVAVAPAPIASPPLTETAPSIAPSVEPAPQKSAGPAEDQLPPKGTHSGAKSGSSKRGASKGTSTDRKYGF